MEHDDLERRLGALGQHPLPPGLASEHLTRIAEAGTRSRWHGKLRVGAAFLAGLLLGGSGLAAAGALPDPVQHAAHQALDRVGVEVPDPERYHGEECGDEVRRNHGAYVRDDHSLAQSRCGKPVSAGTEAGEGADGPKEKGPCQGPPPWAGPDKADMTPEEKAAAQAAREAACGAEEAEAGAAEVESDAEPDADATTTTTVAAKTTTTTEATTTTTTAAGGAATTETTVGS
jgi:hypothetical protein